jgi:hypothetical protein
MTYTQIMLNKRSVDPVEAAQYVGGIGLLRQYEKAGWLRPYVRGKRCTRYDLVDLDGCIDRHKKATGEGVEPFTP